MALLPLNDSLTLAEHMGLGQTLASDFLATLNVEPLLYEVG